MSDSAVPEIIHPAGIDDLASTLYAGFGDAMADAMKKGVRTLSDQSKGENIAIYVDYDNVYWTLMNRYNHDPNQADPVKNLFEQLWKRYPRDKVRSFRVYADFEKVPTNLTSLQRKRIQIRHVYSNDRNGDERKNASDIGNVYRRY